MATIEGMPLVSCLCVTENRVALLRRAVACFLEQTYPHRELLIVHRRSDTATRAYLEEFSDPMVRGVEVPDDPELMLGGVRNLAIAASRGEYVSTWDDDDWSAPARLATQIDTIRAHGRPACVLRRWLIYDMPLRRAFLSYPRHWEASLVCARDVLPEYPNWPRSEDRYVVTRLLQANRLIQLDWPELYIYVYHGTNTSGRIHFKRNVFTESEPLPPARAERIRALLGLD